MAVSGNFVNQTNIQVTSEIIDYPLALYKHLNLGGAAAFEN